MKKTNTKTYGVIPHQGTFGRYTRTEAAFETAGQALTYAKRGGKTVIRHREGFEVGERIWADTINRQFSVVTWKNKDFFKDYDEVNG